MARTIKVDCLCKGRNMRCLMCDGTGKATKKACQRCNGTGKEGPNRKCPDCRGDGWRELDNITY